MESCPEARQYNAIWSKLRALSRQDASSIGVSIAAPRPLHKRIIKAVQKEKWMDLAFKIGAEPFETFLSHSRKTSIITFYLEYRTPKVLLKPLTPEDF